MSMASTCEMCKVHIIRPTKCEKCGKPHTDKHRDWCKIVPRCSERCDIRLDKYYYKPKRGEITSEGYAATEEWRPICSHCETLPSMYHTYSCATRPRCEECDQPSDVSTWYHKSTCSVAVKCDDCSVRLDSPYGDDIIHRMGCQHNEECHSCHSYIGSGVAKCPYCDSHECSSCYLIVDDTNEGHHKKCPDMFCYHCKVDIRRVHLAHKKDCPLVPKCEECGGRSDRNSTRHHKSECSVVPKCEECGTRIDLGKNTHHRAGCTM